MFSGFFRLRPSLRVTSQLIGACNKKRFNSTFNIQYTSLKFPELNFYLRKKNITGPFLKMLDRFQATSPQNLITLHRFPDESFTLKASQNGSLKRFKYHWNCLVFNVFPRALRLPGRKGEREEREKRKRDTRK